MDALIRSAQLAQTRTRLSERRAADGAPSTAALPAAAAPTSTVARDPVRVRIEAQVRAEYEAQAQELYDRELARAREEGLESATRDAQAAAANDVTKLREEITSRVESAVNALQAAHAEALAKLEASVGEVTFAALCRLVGRQMTAKSFVLEQVVRACSQLRVDTVATARLHPRDVQTLSDLLQGQELRLHTLGLKVVPDASLTLGGCIIEADSGQFDGGLENQLRRLHAALAQPAPRADATKPPDEGG